MKAHRGILLAGLALFTIARAAETHGEGRAGELRVACANGFRPILARIESALEAPVQIDYDEGAVLLRRLAAGERPDVVILTRDALEPLVRRGLIVADSLADLAATDRLGIAVRRGERLPATGSPADFRQWLLGLSSIAVTDPAVGGASVRQFFDVLDRLGIAADVRPKLMLVPGAGTSNAGLVTAGRAQAAVQLSHLLRGVDGIELVPVPFDFRGTVTFTAGVVAGSANQDAAAALIRYLHGSVGTQAIEASGMRRIP
jgi:molybdate transport system substrate-binding protein